jgi:hypothetical protein
MDPGVAGPTSSYPYGRLVNDRLWHLPDRVQLLISRPDSMRTSLKRSASSWAPRSPHDGATCHSARRCSKRYIAECCICGFSLRLADGLFAVGAVHIRWHPSRTRQGYRNLRRYAPCIMSIRPRTITVREHLRVRVAPALAGSSASDLFNDLDGPGGTAASGRRVLPELRAPPLASR